MTTGSLKLLVSIASIVDLRSMFMWSVAVKLIYLYYADSAISAVDF
jgi:hypothetical protein